MSFATEISAAALQQIAISCHDFYVNQGKSPITQNDQNRPLLKALKGRKKDYPFINNEISINVQTVDDDTDYQEAYGRTQIDYATSFFGDKFTFNGAQGFITLEVVHDDLRGMGYKVKSLDGDWAKPSKMSKAQKREIFEYMGELLARKLLARDIRLDEYLHRDGSGNLSIGGLAALFPTVNTTGSIGGIARASNVWARHGVATGLTTATGGTLRSGIDNLIREANRFAVTGGINYFIGGSSVLDAIKTYAQNNAMSLNGDLSGVRKLDPSIPDSAVMWDNKVFVYDPTLDTLADKLGAPTLKKTAYGINLSTLEMAVEADKEFSRPADEYNLMVSRFAWRDNIALLCNQPNANFVFTVA